jgi:hypothetical protein
VAALSLVRWRPDGWMANYIGRSNTRKSSRSWLKSVVPNVSIAPLTPSTA